MITTRKEIFREQIAVEPQYENIKRECYATLRRLGADLLAADPARRPRDRRARGRLARARRRMGAARARRDATIVQQAVQALIRIEATERLRARELEFAELKRFFPPQSSIR